VSVTAPPQRPQQPRQQQPPPAGGGTWQSQLHPRGRGGKWIVSHGAGYGAAGPDQTTKQLQQRLQQLGFHVPADGKFGPDTQDAVKAFQARYGLDTSGGVDAATMEVLQNPPTETLAQVQAGNRATRRAASAAARKTATATAKAKAARRTTRVRASAGGRTGGRGGVPAGTNTTVIGPGHLGNGELRQGAGMTGVKNEAVANLQTALNQTGAKLAKDGRFGPRTEAAVRQLQQAHGLAADGIVGPETKGLLIGLQASTSTAKKAKSTAKKSVKKPLPGEVATLRTKSPHARHSSRTAGSRMRIKPPAKGIATLKYSAEVPTKQPDLEEATIAFGYGGEPSRSIKDFREQEPAYDLPVWLPEQIRADVRDLTIQDGRPPYQPPPPGNTTIDDGRIVELQAALTEAVTARQAAKDGREFARARAREQMLRTRLQEAWSDAARAASLAVRRALTALKPGESTALGAFHVKRESGGKFELYGPGHRRVSSHSTAIAAAAHLVRAKQGLPNAALSTLYPVEEASVYSDRLKSAETNKPFDLGGGFTGLKLSTGHYVAGNGTEHIHHEDPERVARVVGAHLRRKT
jgi:peptidoglycan hydrolase-like protein with peptidoglycan-binding domain